DPGGFLEGVIAQHIVLERTLDEYLWCLDGLWIDPLADHLSVGGDLRPCIGQRCLADRAKPDRLADRVHLEAVRKQAGAASDFQPETLGNPISITTVRHGLDPDHRE